jgi:sugar phosphate isomerase/epimerase
MTKASTPAGCPEATGTPVAVNVKSCFEALGPERGLQAVSEAGFRDVVLWAGESLEFVDAARRAREMDLRVIGMATPKLVASSPASEAEFDRLYGATLAAEVPILALIFGDAEDAWAPSLALLDALRTTSVQIAIENTADPGTYTSSPTRLGRLIRSLGSCRIVLDLGHAAVASVGPDEFDSGWVAWTDLHDNDGVVDRHWPLGSATGVGDSCAALTPDLAGGPLVIETDAAAGGDVGSWVESLRGDRELAADAVRARRELPRVSN